MGKSREPFFMYLAPFERDFVNETSFYTPVSVKESTWEMALWELVQVRARLILIIIIIVCLLHFSGKRNTEFKDAWKLVFPDTFGPCSIDD